MIYLWVNEKEKHFPAGNFTTMIYSKSVNFEEQLIVTQAESYSWHGDRFTLRPNQQMKLNVKSESATASDQHLVKIEDEDLGALVIIENITLLNGFLNGPARRPFLVPRKDYIIVLKSIHTNWRATVSVVLQKLWEEYGLYKVLILAPCNSSTENVQQKIFKIISYKDCFFFR